MDIANVAKLCAPLVSEQLQAALAAGDCSKVISPRSRAALYANNRNRYVPAIGTAPSGVIGGLAAGSESTALTISTDRIARAFQFTYVQFDAGTTYASLVMNVYVGGNLREQFSGVQLDPATNNGCIASACQVMICAGEVEDITVTFTNVSAAALAAGANVRVQGRMIMDGDPEFPACWGEECKEQNVPIPAGCACKMK